MVRSRPSQTAEEDDLAILLDEIRSLRSMIEDRSLNGRKRPWSNEFVGAVMALMVASILWLASWIRSMDLEMTKIKSDIFTIDDAAEMERRITEDRRRDLADLLQRIRGG